MNNYTNIYKKYLLFPKVLVFFLSTSIFAGGNTDYWTFNYDSSQGVVFENRSGLGLFGIKIMQSEGDTIFLCSPGVSFRRNTVSNEIRGIYLIHDNIMVGKHCVFMMNLGFERARGLLHEILNFYVSSNGLEDRSVIAPTFPFEFGVDYQYFQQVSSSFWLGTGIYMFYSKMNKNGIPNISSPGFALEVQYNPTSYEKFQISYRLCFNKGDESSMDLAISYANHSHYNPTGFRTPHQLKSLPLRRHLAPFEFFLPITKSDIPKDTYADDFRSYTHADNTDDHIPHDNISKPSYNIEHMSEEELSTRLTGDDIHHMPEYELSKILTGKFNMAMGIPELRAADKQEKLRYYRKLSLQCHPDKNLNRSEEIKNFRIAIFKRMTPICKPENP